MVLGLCNVVWKATTLVCLRSNRILKSYPSVSLCPEKNYFKNGSPENDTNNYHLLRILWETL